MDVDWVTHISGLIFLPVLLYLLAAINAYLTCGICKSKTRMDNKTVLVTGANCGIGKETAKELARRGARVIMACRNIDTANKARVEIIESTGNHNVLVIKLDLSSLKAVREFAQKVNENVNRLDVLIHNAGYAQTFKKTITEDGLETTMATNHYGPFLLTHLLIDLLKKSAPSRIIVVGSESYRMATLTLDNVNPVESCPVYNYCMSKYANISFTKELARRLDGTKVTANCLNPGMVDSEIWRNVPFPLNLPLLLIIKGLAKSSEQGCQTTIFCAVSEELENVSGHYFMDCKEREINAGASDMDKAYKFWNISMGLVNLQATDPKI